jgi:hypothetical protein
MEVYKCITVAAVLAVFVNQTRRQHARASNKWRHMPAFVADRVMTHLNWDRAASAAFRSVCTEWQEVHDWLLPRLWVRTLPPCTADDDDARKSSWGRLIGVKNLDLCGCRNLSDEGLRLLTPLASSLISLNLSLVSNDGFATTWRCRASVTDQGMHALARLTALTDLNLSCCDEVSETGLQVLRSLTALATLNLAYCRDVGDDGVLQLAPLTSLTSLSLSHTKLTDKGLTALRPLTNLTSLVLIGTRLTSEGLTTFTAPPTTCLRLTTLDLSLCRQVSDAGLAALVPLASLTNLNLSSCKLVSDEGNLILLSCFLKTNLITIMTRSQ